MDFAHEDSAKPRIAAVPDDQFTPDQKEVVASFLKRGPMLNIFRTLLNAPKAARGFFLG